MTADPSNPVLVFPAGDHGPLAITRSLGRMGVAVYNAHFQPHAFSFYSRYCRGKFRLDHGSERPEQLLQALLSIGRKIGKRTILVPTSDEAALFVADYAEPLKERFLFPDAKAALVHSLCSKKEMYYLARRCSIPTPETDFPRSRKEVLAFLDHAAFPIMLKGIDGDRLANRTGYKMFIVRSKRELLEKYDMAEDQQNPNLMIQEYIPGGEDSVWMFNGYFSRESECLVGFTGKKIRQYRAYTGCTSLGICLRNQEVDQMTRAFMAAVGYQGILDMGYRYDARDGRYKVLDINPRIGSTFRLFVGSHGMDVARAMYLDLTGGVVQAEEAKDGRKWLVEDTDFASSIQYLRDGNLSIREWLTSFRGVEELAYLAADDPLPLLPLFLNRSAEQIRRVFRRPQLTTSAASPPVSTHPQISS
jgi:D-aspartate ligase